MPTSPSSLLSSVRIPSLREIRAEQERRASERERLETARNAEAIRARCKTLAGFVREAWHVLEPNATFVHNWHIDAICQHLEAITFGTFLKLGLSNRLLINVPPGSMKSLLVSVFWQAWEWGPCGKRSLRYLATAFSEDPVKRDTRKCRDLIRSDWYQALWPEVVLTRTGEMSFANSGTGTREGVPFGSLTGQRGDRLIIDDPHSTETAESPAERIATTRKFREGALNRLNDQEQSAIVVIMQRLHEQDVSGVIQSLRMPYVHVCLPMEFERERACETPIGFRDPRTHEGDLLDPVRSPRETVEQLKKDMGSHAYAGQYQQRPSAREGGMFKRHWFQIVDAIPAEARRKVRRWDLAATIPKPGADPDWTASVKMSTGEGKFYFEDVTRFRESAAKVRKAIQNTASQDGRSCDIVVPQDPGQAGKDQAASIIAENAGYKIYAEKETGAKETRAEPLAAQCEAGNVYLLRGPWNEGFIDEMCAFPTGHDDRFDAAAGAFNWLAGKPKPLVISDSVLARSAQGMRPHR